MNTIVALATLATGLTAWIHVLKVLSEYDDRRNDDLAMIWVLTGVLILLPMLGCLTADLAVAARAIAAWRRGDATGALRAFRGDREFWLVANGRGDIWDFDTKAEALKWVDHRVACGEAPAVWPVRVESEESA